jgi:hypothetical protein
MSRGVSTSSIIRRQSSCSSTGNGSGTNARQFGLSGDATGSSSFTTRYSSLDGNSDTHTETASDIQLLGTNGLISSGADVTTLASSDTGTMTYSEACSTATQSWGTGNSSTVSYSQTETNTLSNSLSDYTSLGIGSNGTITGGTVTSLTTQSFDESQSIYESGATSDADPEGGPGFGGIVTLSSMSTSDVDSVNQGSQSLGALGTISGGGNCFTYNENDSDSLSETDLGDYWMAGQSNTASFSEYMAGTETYAPGGAISGGGDSFTWIQSAYDNATIVQVGNSGTMGATSNYVLSLGDIVVNSISDVGNDILGASDTILGGCDTYSLIEERFLPSTILDYGDASTPYYLFGYGWDDFYLSDTGSSTLTTNGHVYATDTFGYNENSGDTASETQLEGALFQSATAYDYDIDSVGGTITVSDMATTSFDSFTLLDTHSFSAYVAGSSTGSTSAESWYDSGYDDNVLAVTGTESSTGCSYSFIDTDSNGFEYVLDEVITGGSGMNYDLTIVASSMTEESGTASGSPDPYSFISWTTESYSETDSGASTGTLGEVNDFSFEFNSSDGYEYTLTGPPAGTITDVNTTSTSTSGGDPQSSSNGTLIPAYWDTYAPALATSMGSSSVNAPVQDGTTLGEWDTSQGLVSAIGGQDMHALQFTGSEIQPAISGSAVVLEQGGGGSSIWASHPSAIGYRRQGYANTGSHGGSGSGANITIDAVAPEFDSGMNIVTDGEEMERLTNFNQGAEENPTVAQEQPTSRAMQQVVATAAGGGDPLTDGIMDPSNDNTPLGANVNPYTGPGTYNPFPGLLGSPPGAPPGAGVGGGNGPIGKSPFSNQMGTASPGRSPGQTAAGPPPPASPGPGPNSSANVDPLTLLAMLSVLSNGAQTNNAQPGSSVGPPQPGDELGPLTPDPYAGYVPFSYGGTDYLVPPDSAEALLGVLNVSSTTPRGGNDPALREFGINLSVYAQYSNPFLSVASSQTHPDDVFLHYGMQGANVVALVDLPVSGWNFGRNSWNLLRAARGANMARQFAAGGEGVLALKTAANASRFASIREALSGSNGALLSPAEREGIKFTIRRIEAEGYELGGSVKYSGNQGVDLWFRGTGVNTGRIGLAEAKASSGLGSLTRDTLGIRQGSYDFFDTRLQRGGRLDLLNELRTGNADLFGGFSGSGRLYQFDPLLFSRDVNFRTTPGAATLIP